VRGLRPIRESRNRRTRAALRLVVVLLAGGTLLLPAAVPARAETLPAEAEDAGEILVVSADAQLDFARSYLEAERPDDAIRELERFLHFFSDDARAVEARYAIGQLHLRAGDPERAARELQAVAAGVGDGPHAMADPAVRAHFTLATAYTRMNEPGRAAAALQDLAARTENPEIRDAAFHRMGWIYLEAEAWRPAQLSFANIRPEAGEKYRLSDLDREMGGLSEIPRKRPAAAGALAAIPGAGYLYLGRHQDALIAFVLNGAIGLAAWEAFDGGNEALGGLLSAVGFGFYSGSIYGSISAAHKFNRDRTRDFLDRLKDRVGVGLSRGPSGDDRIGLGFSVDF
jgi:tetratricopeptide (TPR) repeat protein